MFFVSSSLRNKSREKLIYLTQFKRDVSMMMQCELQADKNTKQLHHPSAVLILHFHSQ